MNSIEAVRPEFDLLISPDTKLETIADGLVFTEGPVWDSRRKRLLFLRHPRRHQLFLVAGSRPGALPPPGWLPQRPDLQPPGRPDHLRAPNPRGDRHQRRRKTSSGRLAFQRQETQLPQRCHRGRRRLDPVHRPNLRPAGGQRRPGGSRNSLSRAFIVCPRMAASWKLVTDSFERPNGLALSLDEKAVVRNRHRPPAYPCFPNRRELAIERRMYLGGVVGTTARSAGRTV